MGCLRSLFFGVCSGVCVRGSTLRGLRWFALGSDEGVCSEVFHESGIKSQVFLGAYIERGLYFLGDGVLY